MSEEKANLKDLRAKQVIKVFADGIKSERVCPFIPEGVENELMDVIGDGRAMGDCEIGKDGFIEIMFLIRMSDGIAHVVKLKRLPEEKRMRFQVW